MRKLRIAIAATVHKKVSKDSTGGTEIFAYLLSEELFKRGHDVTVIAASDSDVSCKLVGIQTEEKMNLVEQGERLFYGYQLLAAQTLCRMQNEFDIIHCNYYEPFLFSPFSKIISQPIIYSVHSDLFASKAWQEVTSKTVKDSDVFVFVSKHAYEQAALLPNKEFIYNGIDVSLFPYIDANGGDLLWFGRVRRKKGILQAVQTTIASGQRLIISGVIDNADEKRFFETEVEPLIQKHKNITFMGPADFPKKVSLYKSAKALLFPVLWEEPFGLVLAEAMSCGTPIIAYARGACAEIIVDGETGFLVNPSDDDIRGDFLVKKTGSDGLVEAIQRVYALSNEQYTRMRRNSRKRVEQHFSVERMVDEYEKTYLSLVNT